MTKARTKPRVAGDIVGYHRRPRAGEIAYDDRRFVRQTIRMMFSVRTGGPVIDRSTLDGIGPSSGREPTEPSNQLASDTIEVPRRLETGNSSRRRWPFDTRSRSGRGALRRLHRRPRPLAADANVQSPERIGAC